MTGILTRLRCRLGFHRYRGYARGNGQLVYYCDCGKRKKTAWERKHG